MDGTKRQHQVVRAAVVTVWINVLLTAIKLLAGVAGGSQAMLSDAVHSGSDVLSTLVVLVGVRLAGKDSDREHPFGHERLECVAALLLAGLLAATGVGVGWAGLRSALQSAGRAAPGAVALWAALLSIVCKEGMYWYTRRVAKQTDSPALMADAWHHRSDALSSVGSFAGILGARLGLPALDPMASVLICLLILKAAWEVFRDAVAKLIDTACPRELEEAMRTVALAQEGVLRLDRLQTRLFGERVYVEIDLCADAGSSFTQAHGVAARVHHAIEGAFPQVKHCMVHVNPLDPTGRRTCDRGGSH